MKRTVFLALVFILKLYIMYNHRAEMSINILTAFALLLYGLDIFSSENISSGML